MSDEDMNFFKGMEQFSDVRPDHRMVEQDEDDADVFAELAQEDAAAAYYGSDDDDYAEFGEPDFSGLTEDDDFDGDDLMVPSNQSSAASEDDDDDDDDDDEEEEAEISKPPVKESLKEKHSPSKPRMRDRVKEVQKDFAPVPVSEANKAPLSGLTLRVDSEVEVSGTGSGITFIGDGTVYVANDGVLQNCNFHAKEISVFGRVEGDIVGKELSKVTVIDGGKVIGTICSDTVVVENGIVVGKLYGSSVKINNGAVKGNIIAKEDILVGPGSKIKGDVESGHLDIDKMAVIAGKCTQYSSGVDIPDDVFE